MNPRTRDFLALGLFVIILGNSVMGWVRGTIDLTIITSSSLGLLGVLVGVKPWKNGNGAKKPPVEDEEVRT